jgi:hypothetical protein
MNAVILHTGRMTNATNHNHHANRGSNPSGDAPLTRSVRRLLASVRRGWNDASYLNRRLFERP